MSIELTQAVTALCCRLEGREECRCGNCVGFSSKTGADNRYHVRREDLKDSNADGWLRRNH